jgi:hypothetical protein
LAARKRKVELSDEWKGKIRAGVIMQRLLGHVQGEVELSSTQVAAAKILLGKIVPDVNRTEHTGKDGAAIETVSRVELVALK